MLFNSSYNTNIDKFDNIKKVLTKGSQSTRYTNRSLNTNSITTRDGNKSLYTDRIIEKQENELINEKIKALESK